MRIAPLLLLLPLILSACLQADDGTLANRVAPVTLPPIDAAGGEGTLTLGGTSPFTAHGLETFEFSFEVGPSGLEAGGGFLLLDPILHGISTLKYMDWEPDPSLCNDAYAEGVDSTRYEGLAWAEVDVGGVVVTVLRPDHTDDMHQEMYTEITVDGPVPAGSIITLYIGMAEETPLGPANELCHVRAPFRAYQHMPWYGASRSDETATWAMLDSDPPVMRIYGDQTAELVRVIVPSFAQVGETIPVRLAVLDEFGNACEGESRSFVLQTDLAVDGLPPAVDLPLTSPATTLLQATPQAEGVLRIAVQGSGALTATSNPCVVSADPPETRLLWGDIHSHHGISHYDVAGDIVDENLEYARDVAALDFSCETMKLPPLEVAWEELWVDLQAGCATYTSDDFVPILGFEWMGLVGAGHHNVYFDDCVGEVTDSWSLGGLDGPDGLWAFLDEVLADNPGLDAISVPHATKHTGFGWAAQDDDYRPIAEVFSEWGESIESDGERAVTDGLIEGNTMGFIASSDNHDGFMGNPLAIKNDKGGLVAVLAEQRTRDVIFEALATRASYGTKVERIIALMGSDENDYRARMGEVLVGFEPTFRIEVHGTQPLQNVTLYRIYLDEDAVEVAEEWTFDGGELDAMLTLEPGDDGWELDAPALFFAHVDEEGEGEAWTSPIYLYPDCDAEVDDPAGLCSPDDDDSEDDDSEDDDSAMDDDSAVDDDTDPQDDDVGPDDDDCSCRVDGPVRGSAVLSLLALLLAIAGRRVRGVRG